MIPPLTLDINAEHSCNWKCCFGCKEVVIITPPNTPKRQDSEIFVEEIVKKTTHVYHAHHQNVVPEKNK